MRPKDQVRHKFLIWLHSTEENMDLARHQWCPCFSKNTWRVDYNYWVISLKILTAMCTATHFDVFSQKFSQNKSDQSHSFPSIRTGQLLHVSWWFPATFWNEFICLIRFRYKCNWTELSKKLIEYLNGTAINTLK